MMPNIDRRTLLGAGASTAIIASTGLLTTQDDEPDDADDSDEDGEEGDAATETPAEDENGPTDECPVTPLDGDVEEEGDLTLSSPEFEDGEQMPDFVGAANENENPPLEIEDVPEEAQSLVLVFDDPDAHDLVGHTFDHWLAWNIDPEIGDIPRGWDGGDAVEGYHDNGEQGYMGPSPPEGTHEYRFKLFAIADELEAPEPTRKSRLGSVITTESEVLGATQIVGAYDAEQGTLF